MSIKLLATDLDGTVLCTDKSVTKRTLEAIRGAIEKGVVFVPTTGRIAKMVPKQIISLPGVRFAITSNGASLLDLRDKCVLFSNLMTMEASVNIVRFFSSYGLLVEAYCDGVSYTDREALKLLPAELPEQVYDYIMESQTFVDHMLDFIIARKRPLEKVNVPFVPDELKPELLNRLSAMPEYVVTSSGNINMEVNSASANKGNALRQLCTRLEISPSQVMAIGDANNDIAMLEYAGFSVAMGNAADNVKRAADFVTATNDDDGVAFAIEKFVLSA